MLDSVDRDLPFCDRVCGVVVQGRSGISGA